MTLRHPITSDHQLGRLLQIGVVLEEVIEARATQHLESSDGIDSDLETLLEDAVTQANQHRAQLETLIADLEAETVDYEDIEPLVEAQYQADQDFDDIIYDQLCNAETAYKFFDDLLDAIDASDAEFSVDHEELVSVLKTLREAEAGGVETVTDFMEARR